MTLSNQETEAPKSQRKGKTSSKRGVGAIITVISTAVTICLSVGNYMLKRDVEATETRLKERAQAIEESKEKIEESRERIARYDYVYKILKAVDGSTKAQQTLAKNICRLALTSDEQGTLFFGLELSDDRALAEIGRQGQAAIAPPTPSPGEFPVYVNRTLLTGCMTRGGDDKCVIPGQKVTLGGKEYSRGVVFTQSFPSPAMATVMIPKNARSFGFTVGDYWTGNDCGGQRPMIMSVLVDGDRKWGPTSVADVHSDLIHLPEGARFLVLRGDSGDGDTRCDDSVWVNARFE